MSTQTLPSLLFVLAVALLAPVPASAQGTVVVTVAPTIPTSAPQFVDPTLFTSAILNSTNVYRTSHNATPVAWNATLQSYAQSYLNSTCDFAHSGGPYGENLALGCSDAASCVDMWGDESAAYDYGDPNFSEQTGHFTQLVWKNTTDVGCGARLCGDSGWYLACEYWPRGNVIGQFGDEVGKDENGGGKAVGLSATVLGLAVIGAGYWVAA
jgi:uncharacterized protein YkwD